MKPSIKFFAVLMALISLTVLACSISGLFQGSKENKYPPFETKGYQEQKSDEDKKRYVIADMQLGGKQVYDYYLLYTSQAPVIQQAITLYDNDVRIINIYQFNRVQINNEWTVIYGGSNNIILQGNDVVLTDDIGGDADGFDARVKYMLADMQLGSVVDYYRQFTDDLAVATAVKWWDVGVRIENIADFDRVIVNTAGWKVVYKGTENTVNSNDIILVDAYKAQVSYIVADMQLGDVFDYYNARTNEPAIAEAVSLWNQNARVENIKDFEREVVGDMGWKVTYKGTNIPVYGTEIKMPVATQSQKKCELGFFWGVSFPTAPSNLRYVYQLRERSYSGLSDTSMDEVNIRNRSAGSCDVWFDVKHTLVSTSSVYVTNDDNFEKQNQWDYDVIPSFIFWKEFPDKPLPAKLRVGDSVSDRFEEYIYKVVAIENITVPAGTFETYRLETIQNYQNTQANYVIWISKGVGVVKMEITSGEIIPGNGDYKMIELIEFSGAGR